MDATTLTYHLSIIHHFLSKYMKRLILFLTKVHFVWLFLSRLVAVTTKGIGKKKKNVIISPYQNHQEITYTQPC